MRRIDADHALNKNGNSRGIEPDGPATQAAFPPPGITPLLLTEEQAAELLSLSPRKVWELAAAGAIPFVKIGSLKRYRRADLEEWVGRGCPTTGA